MRDLIKNLNLLRTEEMLLLYRSGKTLQEIADVYNLSRQRIQSILTHSPDYVRRIKKYTIHTVCLNCNRPTGTCNKYCSRKCVKYGYWYKNYRILKKCLYCGKEKWIEKRTIKRQGWKFCSCKCFKIVSKDKNLREKYLAKNYGKFKRK